MLRSLNYLSALLLCVINYACKQSFDKDIARKQIMQVLRDERTAHFQKDVNYFTSSVDTQLVSVNNGIVSIPTPAESAGRWKSYFDKVAFIKWDDAAEPIIRISDDGSLAYAIVQKIVVVKPIDSTGNAGFDTTHFAWTSIYRRTSQHWKLEAVTSTHK